MLRGLVRIWSVSVSTWIVGQTGRLQVSRKAGMEFEITLLDQTYDLENRHVYL